MRIKEIKTVYPDKIGIYPVTSGTIPFFNGTSYVVYPAVLGGYTPYGVLTLV